MTAGLGRALAVGAALGALLAVCNTAMGLRVGWFDTGSLTAALLGGALLRLIRRPPSLEHHNLLQTLASSMATIPATAGLVAAVPVLLGGQKLSVPSLLLWAVACGVWGVLWALPFRQRLLDEERLPFPTGQATAEAMTQTTAEGGRARVLVFGAALGGAGLFTLLRDGAHLFPLDWLWGFGAVGLTAEVLGLGLALSPLSVGAGLMGGFHIGASLIGGALAARLLLVPALVSWRLVPSDPEAVAGWLLWPGVGLLLGAAAPSLARLFSLLIKSRGVRALRLSPRVLGGMALSLGTLMAVAHGWGASPWAVGACALVAVPLMVASTRSAGQTDIAPLAPMGQLGQVFAATLASGAASTVTAGAVPAGAGAHMANTFWTLRAGRLLGLRDEPQIAAQLAGVVLGALVCVPAFLLMTSAATVGSEALPVPWAAQWRAVAQVLAAGESALPAGAAWGLAAGLALGVLLAVLEERKLPVPSALAVGLGFLLPVTVCATMALGGLLELVLRRRGAIDRLGLPLAAGLIAGESVFAVGLMAVAAVRG